MSTHPRTEPDDLDRTDELPRLDIAAYEARLAEESSDALASTDTWAVEGLRDAEAAPDDTAAARFARARTHPPGAPQTDVTLEATRILGRIEQLEAELATSRAHEHELAARIERLSNEVTVKENQARGLSADNARLTEQRSLAAERIRALEQQLQEDTTLYERKLAQQRELREREEKNSAQLALHLATKIAEHAGAHQEVARRAAMIAALTQARDDLAGLLDASRSESAELTTQLVDLTAKYKAIDLTLRERDDTIAALEKRSGALENDLRIAHDARVALTNERADLQRMLQEQAAGEQNRHSEKSSRIQDLERELAESQLRRDLLTGEADALRARLQQLENEARQDASAREALNTKATELERVDEALAQTQRELDEARASLARKQKEIAERAQESENEALQHAADLADAQRQLHQQRIAVQSLEQAIRARDTLADRLRAELQTSQDERAIMAGQLEKSRVRNKSLSKDIFGRDNQIAALKADLAVHVEALAAIRQDINRASARVEQPDRILEPVDHVGDIIELNKKVMTIGRTSDNDICIPSKLVSRTHARLLVGPNAVIVEDAGSTNGCLVNEAQIKQHAMREGDILSIGDLKYRLRTRAEHDPHDHDNVVPFQ